MESFIKLDNNLIWKIMQFLTIRNSFHFGLSNKKLFDIFRYYPYYEGINLLVNDNYHPIQLFPKFRFHVTIFYIDYCKYISKYSNAFSLSIHRNYVYHKKFIDLKDLQNINTLELYNVDFDNLNIPNLQKLLLYNNNLNNNFKNLNNLIWLDMCDVKTDCEILKNIPNLKKLYINKCYITEIYDLHNLEFLYITECQYLEKIYNLDKLSELTIKYCYQLNDISDLINIKELYITSY